MILVLVDRVKISVQLSASLNIQSRHVTDFQNISRLLDVSLYAVHGYAVDITCEHTIAIFQQASIKTMPSQFIVHRMSLYVSGSS